MTLLLATIDPWILAFSALTVIATIWMGFWSAKRSKTASDFFVAGRSVSVGWNASAISGEYLSAASFMGVAGMVMSSGYDALWYPVCYACGYLFLLLFIAGPLRRFGAYTIPDFAEGRFDSPVFRKIAVVFVLFIGFFYTMPQMKGAGTTLAYIFPGLPYWVGVVLVGAVITLNVALGGMKGITLVQAFQYWAKMFAISVPIFVLMAVYGHYGKQVGVNAQRSTSNIQLSTNATVAALDVNRSLHFKTTEEYRTVLDHDNAPTESNAVKRIPDVAELPWYTNTIQAPPLSLAPAPSSRGSSATALFMTPRGAAELVMSPDLIPASNLHSIAESKSRSLFVRLGGKNVKMPAAAAGLVYDRVLSRLDSAGSKPDVQRQPLPDKAPRDDSWLNPFGPLTTKAAKAANAVPRWNLSSELRSRLVDYRNRPAPSLWESMARSVEGMADGLRSSKPAPARVSQFATFTNLATNATQSISAGFPMLSTLRELGLLLDRPVLVSTNLPRPKPVISGSFQTRDQFVNYLIALLLTNGVRLDLSGAAIKAMAAGDWERYQRSPAGVSFVPNHTFAMRVGPFDERQPDGSLILRHIEPRILLASYAEVLGQRALMAANLPTNGVDFNPTFEVMLPHEAKAAMEQTFRERGITIIPAGDKEVWAVPTAELARYQLPPVDPRPLSLLYTYSLIIALVCGTAGLPHILVRFYTNPDGVAAKRTTMWVMILIGVFYVFPPVFGVMGRNLLPALYSGVGAKGTDKIVLELPRILNEGRGEKGEVRAAGDPSSPAPRTSHFEGRGEKDEVRTADVPSPLAPRTSHFPRASRFPWGSILSGITCAGAFAAFMSTFSGLLVSMTGAMAHDIYGRMLNPNATPQQRLRAFKIGAVIIGGVAILLGMQVEPLQINFMVGQAFAIAAASYFPLLFVSVWWGRLTMKGAATGMLTGGTLALAGITLTSFTDLKWLPFDAFWAAHPLLRILCEQPALWAVPLAIALMVIVSRLTQKEIPPDIRMKMLVLHAPEKLGLKQEYIQEHHSPH